MIKDLWFEEELKGMNGSVFYFTASKDMLKHFLPYNEYPEAVGTCICIECVSDHLSIPDLFISVSPTMQDEDGTLTDYDWSDVEMTEDEIMECFRMIPAYQLRLSKATRD